MNDIDIVLPYVDSSDPKWRSDYVYRFGSMNFNPCRFRSWGTLKYLFRGIDQYMPFINNIFLIVSRDSQVPDWVNRDLVRIVYHEDFIPQEYLPCFSSCTIEAFLGNITGLSERFIYFNDDLFPNAPMQEDDFFTDNIPHIHFGVLENFPKKIIFCTQCRNSLDMVSDALHIARYPEKDLLATNHNAAPMLASTVRTIYDLCKDTIHSTISGLRKPKNVNQCMYSYYQYFTGNYIDKEYRYGYLEISNDLSELQKALTTDAQLLCLNESSSIKIFSKTQLELKALFEYKFPNKCKYEL